MSAAVSPERAQLIADAEAWQAYAARMNAKAIAAGLVSVEEVAQGRKAAEEALARLPWSAGLTTRRIRALNARSGPIREAP